MKKINKTIPKFYSDFIKRNKPVNWNGINDIRPQLRKYILETEQNSQCAYCESYISSDNSSSHIDHYRRKAGHMFPKLQFEYDNLLVSCNKYYCCAKTKDSLVKSRDDYNNIVDPVHDEPTEYFEYLLGDIIPNKLNQEKGENTIRVFYLQHKSLVRQRRDIASAVMGYKDYLSLEDVIKELGEFESFIRFIW